MKLLTKAILKKLPKLYSSAAHEDTEKELTFHLKLFCPWSFWTWYIAEYDPETGIAFGYTIGFENEYGSIDVKELETVTGPLGLKIERDITFQSIGQKDLMEKIKKNGQ